MHLTSYQPTPLEEKHHGRSLQPRSNRHHPSRAWLRRARPAPPRRARLPAGPLPVRCSSPRPATRWSRRCPSRPARAWPTRSAARRTSSTCSPTGRRACGPRDGSGGLRPDTPRSGGGRPPWKVWSALWVVYIVWGSTYLAIALMVETMPALLGAGLRFVAVGADPAADPGQRGAGSRCPAHARRAARRGLVGMLPGANAMVSVAEKTSRPASPRC